MGCWQIPHLSAHVSINYNPHNRYVPNRHPWPSTASWSSCLLMSASGRFISNLTGLPQWISLSVWVHSIQQAQKSVLIPLFPSTPSYTQHVDSPSWTSSKSISFCPYPYSSPWCASPLSTLEPPQPPPCWCPRVAPFPGWVGLYAVPTPPAPPTLAYAVDSLWPMDVQKLRCEHWARLSLWLPVSAGRDLRPCVSSVTSFSLDLAWEGAGAEHFSGLWFSSPENMGGSLKWSLKPSLWYSMHFPPNQGLRRRWPKVTGY